MDFISPIIFDAFECVGTDCPDTCCAGWGILIDKDTVKYYNTVPGEFGERLRKHIKEENNAIFFELDNEGRCSFLNDSNLCSIYRTLGAEKLCQTCQVFPRHVFKMDDLILIFLSFACPETVKLHFSCEGTMSFKTSYSKEHINNAGQMKPEVYNAFLHSLITGIELLQNRGLSIRERLILFISFIYSQQNNMVDDYNDQSTIQLFADPRLYSRILDDDNIPATDVSSRIKMFRLLCESFFSGNHKDTKLLNIYKEFNLYFQNKNVSDVSDELCEAMDSMKNDEIEQEMEQLLVYLCFRYILSDYNKNDLIRPLGNIIAFYTTYICFIAVEMAMGQEVIDRNKRILVLSRLSRYYEHNADTFSEVHSLMVKNDMSDIFSLMRLV